MAFISSQASTRNYVAELHGVFKAADPDSQPPACTGCVDTRTQEVYMHVHALYSPTATTAIHSIAQNVLKILRQIPNEAVREGGKEGILHPVAMVPITASSYSTHHILRPSMFVEQWVRHVGPGRQEHSSGQAGLVYIINMPCKCALYRVHTLHSRLTSAVTAGCPRRCSCLFRP